MSRSWQSLEAIPSQAAVAAEWNRWLGEDADLFRSAFLRRNGREARSYPCPRNCGCAHQVVKHGDGAIVAVCQCEPNRCDDILLQPADIAVYELNRQKLGRALAAALDATAREADLGIPGSVQIAVYGDDAVPVILAIINKREAFLRCVTGLVARLRDRFVLLAPTDSMLDGNSQEALKNAGAVFLPIEKSFTLTPQGKLHPVRPPAQLLAMHIVKRDKRRWYWKLLERDNVVDHGGPCRTAQIAKADAREAKERRKKMEGTSP